MKDPQDSPRLGGLTGPWSASSRPVCGQPDPESPMAFAGATIPLREDGVY